ncbi:hypothetical protein [Carnobacterium inhibens]|uniref:Uncharacterized protein n=1 Tax=Carnobacterium inhibens subsp. gilichinskyi TaxID=1266845 RepID=U5SC52_9LACT|nr:hypothetical protein [Carnobacterium inhibens]AGY82825.1 hypothetical protein Q783_06890 [Carnobacterium inhibens subsp. gilichinskyi]
MKIILHQKITMTAPRLDYKNVYKKIESSTIPHEGEYIWDTVFTDDTKIRVKTVSVDADRDICNVFLEDFEILHDDHLIIEEILKKYILHGWTTMDE